MNLRHASATHVGHVRQHNEDSYLALPGKLYAVVDALDNPGPVEGET